MRKKVVKKQKAEFKLSEEASALMGKFHDFMVKEVTKFDKKKQKNK